MPFEVERNSLESGVVVLALSGTMTMGNQLERFEWSIQDMTAKKENRIVLDMSKVYYIDSASVGVLMASHGGLRASGGQLRLAGVGERVAAVFKITGVDQILAIDRNRDDSVKALSAGA